MLNLFKLPFGFGSRNEKTPPITDIALGIWKNFKRRKDFGSSPFHSLSENQATREAEEIERLNIHEIKEEFYEIMSNRLRDIDNKI